MATRGATRVDDDDVDDDNDAAADDDDSALSLSRFLCESRDTDSFPTQDQRPSVSFLIILAMSGSHVLPL